MLRALPALLLFLGACNPPSPTPDTELSAQAAALACYRENGFAMLAAHRGGPAPGYPENALSSLQRLADNGVLYAEIDVRRTADDVYFLLHDDTLERTTTGSGDLEGRVWSDLSSERLLDSNGELTNQTIPRLEAVFALARETGLVLNLDLKSVTPAEIVALVDANNARNHVAIIAYTVEDAAAIHALDPGLVLSVPDELDALSASGVNLDASYIWLGTGALNPARDAELASRGLETSVGLFRREDGSATPYLEAAEAGVELLSIDNVDAAVSALGGSDVLQARIEQCRT